MTSFFFRPLGTLRKNSWHFSQKLLAVLMKTLGKFHQNLWHFSSKPLGLFSESYWKSITGGADNHIRTYADTAAHVQAKTCGAIGLKTFFLKKFFIYKGHPTTFLRYLIEKYLVKG